MSRLLDLLLRRRRAAVMRSRAEIRWWIDWGCG
jgi:hypothetical protein